MPMDIRSSNPTTFRIDQQFFQQEPIVRECKHQSYSSSKNEAKVEEIKPKKKTAKLCGKCKFFQICSNKV